MCENDVIFIPPVSKFVKRQNVLTKAVTFENNIIEMAHCATFYYNLECNCKRGVTQCTLSLEALMANSPSFYPKFSQSINFIICFFVCLLYATILLLRHSIIIETKSRNLQNVIFVNFQFTF